MGYKRTENEVVNEICGYLSMKGCFFSRINTMPVFDSKRDCYRSLGKWVRKGCPDIVAIVDTIAIGIECKTDTGRLSKDQKVFKMDWERAGGAYIVARSVQDVIRIGL